MIVSLSFIVANFFLYSTRFDYGISEEIGYRQSMEDSCTILQHMDVSALAVHDLAPQSFFGVFDGHGGPNASLYLSQHLHLNVGNALSDVSPELKGYIESVRDGTLNDTHPMKEHVDKIVIEALQSSFMKTDADFVGSSPHAQKRLHGHHSSSSWTSSLLRQYWRLPNLSLSVSLLIHLAVPSCLYLF